MGGRAAPTAFLAHGTMLDHKQELASLLRRVAERDQAAFATLYSKTSAKLYGIALRILNQRETADEVIQEVFVRIWERAGDFDPGHGSPISWMAAIARNRSLDELRRRRTYVSDAAEEVLEVPDPAMLPSEAAERSQELLRVERCLETLEPDRRAMVRLAYLEGWSREQLSVRFGAPVATIKTWLHRSLAKLRDCLGQ